MSNINGLMMLMKDSTIVIIFSLGTKVRYFKKGKSKNVPTSWKYGWLFVDYAIDRVDIKPN